jgi:hypothetical protein
MPPTNPFRVEDAALGPSMSLIVVERDGTQQEIKTSGDAADYLADSWTETLRQLGERELVAYSPEVVIRTGESRALVIRDDLRDENEIIEELLADGDWPQLKPRAVSSDLYAYAVVSDTQAGRVAMIKKKNPTKRARGGKALFLAGDELRKMKRDPWELDPVFDLVVGIDGGYALNTFFFEQLFADADRLRAKIVPWVSDIASRLPMTETSDEVLAAACDGRPRLRRRLRAIAHRGHIPNVTIADVRRHIRQMDLPEARFIKNGQLVINDDNVEAVLFILNEDFTRGGLTNVPFRIESKEPM